MSPVVVAVVVSVVSVHNVHYAVSVVPFDRREFLCFVSYWSCDFLSA